MMLTRIRDPSGSLKFSSKATLTAKGIEFADGASFQINMDEMDVVGELGKGNYGSVQQVHHRPSNVMMAMKVCLFHHTEPVTQLP
jgi:mitogen-activated protein kinase kinase